MVAYGTISAPKLLSSMLEKHIVTCAVCKADKKCTMFDNIHSTWLMLTKESEVN